MKFIVLFIIAYLLGSISCAILTAKLFNLPDPRTHGSGNAGATNMLRTGNTKAALFVLIGDFLKGLIAVCLALLFGLNGTELGFIALAAVVGHIFPVFFGFRGGKGVATAAGALAPISFLTFIFVAITWGIIVFLTKYVSLASMLSVIAVCIYLLIGGNYVYFLPFLIIAVLIIWKHSKNIKNLRNGTEPKYTMPTQKK